MLIDALDHGEEDLAGAPPARGARRGRSASCRDARRRSRATRDLLEPAKRERIDAAMRALASAAQGDDRDAIAARIEELDEATHDVRRPAHGPRDRAGARGPAPRRRRAHDRSTRTGIERAPRRRTAATGAADGEGALHRHEKLESRGARRARRILEAARKSRRARGRRLRRRLRLLDLPRLRRRRATTLLSEAEEDEEDILERPSTCACDVAPRLPGEDRDGDIEVEITRESFEAFCDEHPNLADAAKQDAREGRGRGGRDARGRHHLNVRA